MVKSQVAGQPKPVQQHRAELAQRVAQEIAQRAFWQQLLQRSAL